MTAGPATAQVETPGSSTKMQRSSRGWWIATAIILIPALVPPVSLAWQVITKGTGTTVPFGRLVELFVNTLTLSAAVTLTSLAIGTATAWLTSRTAIPGRRVWMIIAAMPLVVPSYMAALTIIGATGPAGLISTWLGIEIPTPYGFVGAWTALSVFLAPMAHLIVSPALRLIDPATEEAAVGLGASKRRVFMTITLPQLRPALVSAGLMIGLYTVSDFGAVSLLRFDTFTRAIFTLYEGQIDRRPAAALSLILMVVALAILFVERRTRTRADYQLGTTKRRRDLIRLRNSTRYLSVGFLSIYSLFSLVIPITVLAFWLFRGLGAGADLGTFWDEALRSVGVSLGAAVLAAAASLPVAMVTTWRRNRASPIVESSVWGVYALPHITVGVAVITFALIWLRPMYQTLALLILAYVAMFMAQSVSTVQDSLRRSSPDLEEASRSLGKSALTTLRRVTVPITMPGLLAGAALVSLSVMKELPATLLLRPNGFETLAIRIWSATGEGFYTRASVASLVLLAVSIVPLLALTYRDLSD
ncbi:MAG: iron ABC transporter permease [Actinomycetota bacterium]|nr:iron ABC transporter permease [Actinomycetota bacterium]